MGSCYSHRALEAGFVMATSQSKVPSSKSRFGFGLRPPSSTLQSHCKEDVSLIRNGDSGHQEGVKSTNSFNRVKYDSGQRSGKLKKVTKEKDVINSEIKQSTTDQPEIVAKRQKASGETKKYVIGGPASVSKSRENVFINQSKGEQAKSNVGKTTFVKSGEKLHEVSVQRRSFGFGFKPSNVPKIKNSSTSKENLSCQKDVGGATVNSSSKSETCSSKDIASVNKLIPPSGISKLPKSNGGSKENLSNKNISSISKLPNKNISRENLIKKAVSSEKLSSGKHQDLKLKRDSLEKNSLGNIKTRSRESLTFPKTNIGSVNRSEISLQPNSAKNVKSRPSSLILPIKAQPRSTSFVRPRPLSTSSRVSTSERSQKTISSASIDSADLMLNTEISLDESDAFNSTFVLDKQEKEIVCSPVCAVSVPEEEDVWVKRTDIDCVVSPESCAGRADETSGYDTILETTNRLPVVSPQPSEAEHGQQRAGRVRHLSSLDDTEQIAIDVHLYRSMLQEITWTKTMLLKLKRMLLQENEPALNGFCSVSSLADADKVDQLEALAQENKMLNEEIARLKLDMATRDQRITQLSEAQCHEAKETYNATTQTDKPNMTPAKGQLTRSLSEGYGQTIVRPSIKENLPERTLKLYFKKTSGVDSCHNDQANRQEHNTPRPALCLPFTQQVSPLCVNQLTDDNELVTSSNSTLISYHLNPITREFTRIPKPKQMKKLTLSK